MQARGDEEGPGEAAGLGERRSELAGRSASLLLRAVRRRTVRFGLLRVGSPRGAPAGWGKPSVWQPQNARLHRGLRVAHTGLFVKLVLQRVLKIIPLRGCPKPSVN